MSDTNTNIETKNMSPQARKCYISAPLHTDLKALETLLRERQIEPILSADLSSEAITLLGGIVNVIATADLFIALLDEVKKDAGRKDWKGIVDQVQNYLEISQTRSALLLYVKPADTPEMSPSIAPPNIFFLDIHQLLTAMRTKSFAKVMIDLRNRRVHGI